ncbi:MAG TPA: hypothetical protein VGM54_20610 [Chthoniobacter sp.]|jgi:hypothetical protein
MNRQPKLPTSEPHTIQLSAHRTIDLRRAVSARLMRDFGVRVPPTLIRRVLDEAMETVQETGFPHLFFPAVAEEKARLVFAALGDAPTDQTSRVLSNANAA